MSASPQSSLLKFQIGPVQDFIAQARSTRDLWSGSYLLSWLTAAGIRKLMEASGVELIFPAPEGQPLLDPPEKFPDLPDQQALLTPNLPNIFIARVPTESACKLAGEVEDVIRDEWKKIADSVWKVHGKLGVVDAMESRFYGQVDRHLSIAWLATPETGAHHYREDYAANGWQLDAVRRLRGFKARPGGDESGAHEKDSLGGDHEALAGGKGDAMRIAEKYAMLFKHDDHLSAATLTKRVWHLTYLKGVHKMKTASDEFKIRSIPAIAGRRKTLDDEEASDAPVGEKYIAAIAFDGDSIGKWVSGENLPPGTDLAGHHRRFSRCLGDFAMKRARETVEAHDGFLIYAGGDDVLALVPADACIDCARALRDVFREATGEILDKSGECPDASAGIAIAHVKAPLQDLIREAQAAEKRAKNDAGRAAFSVTLMKHSGEISHWETKWDHGGIELYEKIAALMGGELSSKFPHRVCELLAPYQTMRTGISTQCEAADFPAAEVIAREFQLAAERQGSRTVATELAPLLEDHLRHLKKLGSGTQTLLKSVVGLCTTVAFAHRNRQPRNLSAERQPAQ
jgi:CRISPR-associated protein Cmr2